MGLAGFKSRAKDFIGLAAGSLFVSTVSTFSSFFLLVGIVGLGSSDR